MQAYKAPTTALATIANPEGVVQPKAQGVNPGKTIP